MIAESPPDLRFIGKKPYSPTRTCMPVSAWLRSVLRELLACSCTTGLSETQDLKAYINTHPATDECRAGYKVHELRESYWKASQFDDSTYPYRQFGSNFNKYELRLIVFRGTIQKGNIATMYSHVSINFQRLPFCSSPLSGKLGAVGNGKRCVPYMSPRDVHLKSLWSLAHIDSAYLFSFPSLVRARP